MRKQSKRTAQVAVGRRARAILEETSYTFGQMLVFRLHTQMHLCKVLMNGTRQIGASLKKDIQLS